MGWVAGIRRENGCMHVRRCRGSVVKWTGAPWYDPRQGEASLAQPSSITKRDQLLQRRVLSTPPHPRPACPPCPPRLARLPPAGARGGGVWLGVVGLRWGDGQRRLLHHHVPPWNKKDILSRDMSIHPPTHPHPHTPHRTHRPSQAQANQARKTLYHPAPPPAAAKPIHNIKTWASKPISSTPSMRNSTVGFVTW